MRRKTVSSDTGSWTFTLLAGLLVLFAASAAADFNNDGYDDLAVAAPNKTINSQTFAGMVMEVEGGAGGITTEHDLWHQDIGLADVCEDDDYFGRALATGDFDGDGYLDLAVGIPDEDVYGYEDAGAIAVIYGGSNGLTTTGDQFFAQGDATDGSWSEANDRFGHSLAAADFNNDGFDDLAIGSPLENLGTLVVDAGAVTVVFGSAAGITAVGSQWILQSSSTGSSEEDDRFGTALAAGDFDNDGFADLAIGTPGQTVNSVVEAGVVNVQWGYAGGLRDGPDFDQWHQDSYGISGACDTDDRFGSILFASDFNGDGFDDLVVGVPFEDIEPIVDAGLIHIIDGSAAGLTASGSQMFYQDNFGTNPSEEGDHFGGQFAAGDFDGDGYNDLAVAAPFENWGAAADAGLVQVLPGSAGGLVGAGAPSISEGHLLNRGVVEAGNRFGFGLAAGDFDHDGLADLAIGAPWKDLSGQADAGTVYVMYGTTSGVSFDNDYFDQCTSGYWGGCTSGDLFGWKLAAPPQSGVTAADAIFYDGFEAGGTSAWSLVVP